MLEFTGILKMSLTWRPATWSDLELGISIQPKLRGNSLVDVQAANKAWEHLFRSPYFASAILESSPPILGHRVVGFGASVFISAPFANDEIANPHPDINSRIIASVHLGRSVLAGKKDVARANAGDGVVAVVLCGVWRDELLGPAEKYEAKTLLVSSFVEYHAGYRFRAILTETADEPTREFIQHSIVYRTIAEFPQMGRVIHLMTNESVKAEPASMGHMLFKFREPTLRLRESDQELLLAALHGATDPELAAELGVTLSAVKARWRSTFARIEEVMPTLVQTPDTNGGRGAQKRHRVLAYVRSHPAELRPYDWPRSAARHNLVSQATQEPPSLG